MFLLFLSIIFSIHAVKDRYVRINSQSEELLDERLIGNIQFKSYEHTLTLENNNQNKRYSYIRGQLNFPDTEDRAVPAVILLHGSLGVSNVQTRYAKWFNKIGIATFVVDSFSTRNIQDTVGDQNRVTFNTVTQDAFAALHLLQRHPRILSEKIAVIGWSKGGFAAHQSGTQAYFNAFHNKSSPTFAAHIALYPWCGEHPSNLARSAAPTLMILGDEDDWVGHEACITYANTLQEKGFQTKINVYPEVGHGFDYAGAYRTYLPNAIDWSQCEYVANEYNFVIAATGDVLSWVYYAPYLQQCISKGAVLQSNYKAKQQAKDDILEFLLDIDFINTNHS